MKIRSLVSSPPAVLLLLLAPFVSSVSCGGATAAPFVVDQPAPQLTLPDLQGKSVSLNGRSGRVVVVDFWATWCGPCHLQAEILKRLLVDYGSSTVDVFGVNLGEDAATVSAALRAEPLPYPVLLDPADELTARHEIVGLPSLLVIGRDGKVVVLHDRSGRRRDPPSSRGQGARRLGAETGQDPRQNKQGGPSRTRLALIVALLRTLTTAGRPEPRGGSCCVRRGSCCRSPAPTHRRRWPPSGRAGFRRSCSGSSAPSGRAAGPEASL